MICQQCRQVEKAQGDALPLACSSCGYNFQYGVDKLINYSDIPKNITNAPTGTSVGKGKSNITDPYPKKPKRKNQYAFHYQRTA